jgi:hypothetical protein
MRKLHYWGAKEIVTRLGFKDSRRLGDLKIRLSVPCYMRPDPRCPWRHLYYASESMLLTWELAKAQADRERLIAQQQEKAERKRVRSNGQGSRPLTSHS